VSRPPLPPLTSRQVERSLRLSVLDGVLYSVMVGFGDAYILANAVRLGATSLAQGLVIALPLFGGALGSVLAVRVLARATRRKPVVVAGATLQVLALTSIVLLESARGLGVPALIGIALLHQLGGQAAGTAWSSWYGDLVPPAIRGRYFGRRSGFAYLATGISLVTSGLLLQHFEPGAAGLVEAGAGGDGYRLVFGLAALARLVSVVLLALSPEPRFRGLPDVASTRRFLGTRRGRAAWRLVGAGALLQLLVYSGSPYFGPFMLQGLHFTYVEYMVASVAVVGMKVFVLPLWGRAIDHHGSRPVYLLAAVLVALVPLPWVWANGLIWVVIAQAFSGFAWGAYEVSYFSLVLDATYQKARPYLFAAQNVLVGTSQLLGALGGALLLGLLGHDYRLLFAFGVVARMAVALAVPRVVPAISPRPGVGRRALLLRVIGIRPHGGVTHRPILTPDEDPTKIDAAPLGS
jgi:MFS family permease